MPKELPILRTCMRAYFTNLDYVKGSDLITIIVATPSLANGLFDVLRIEKIVKEIRELDKNVLVTISSNVNVGTYDKLHAC
jgi:UDP-glucose 6-dehydrogenase